ncbi:MAG: GntR family transcriptional regulator [Pseudomonadota bacterium]|nr:GntR family transcriptional regulator [Pseudomonadota bacterium]
MAPNDSAASDPAAGWARPIARENLNDRAYLAIREALTSGHLMPGETLRLRPMSARFGISVTPMREAFIRLVSEKALAFDARGTVVVPALTRAEMEEIGAIRADLEGRGAAQAALRAPAEAIDALERTHLEIVAHHAEGDYRGAVQVNSRFHLELCRMAEGPILLELVEGLWVRTGPTLWHADAARAPRWRPGPHETLIAALRARDPEAAREAMREDVDRWLRGYLAYAADTEKTGGASSG